MNSQVTITTEPINEAAMFAQRAMSAEVGAAVYFLGLVRGTEGNASIKALEYETFQRMAEHQLQLLCDAVAKRLPLEGIRLVHRVGAVKVGEASLWIEVTARHREEAFAACQWLIDEMKRVVPIWKKPVADAPKG
jgi:molybdopterin synthase catalytic subunit